jgi:hypothetical protein
VHRDAPALRRHVTALCANVFLAQLEPDADRRVFKTQAGGCADSACERVRPARSKAGSRASRSAQPANCRGGAGVASLNAARQEPRLRAHNDCARPARDPLYHAMRRRGSLEGRDARLGLGRLWRSTTLSGSGAAVNGSSPETADGHSDPDPPTYRRGRRGCDVSLRLRKRRARFLRPRSRKSLARSPQPFASRPHVKAVSLAPNRANGGHGRP